MIRKNMEKKKMSIRNINNNISNNISNNVSNNVNNNLNDNMNNNMNNNNMNTCQNGNFYGAYNKQTKDISLPFHKNSMNEINLISKNIDVDKGNFVKSNIFNNILNENNILYNDINKGIYDNNIIFVNEKQYDRILKRRLRKVKQDIDRNRKVRVYISIQKKKNYPEFFSGNTNNFGLISPHRQSPHHTHINPHSHHYQLPMNNNLNTSLYNYDWNSNDSFFKKNNENSNSLITLFENMKPIFDNKNNQNYENYISQNNFNPYANNNITTNDEYNKYINICDINNINNLNNMQEINNFQHLNSLDNYNNIQTLNVYNNHINNISEFTNSISQNYNMYEHYNK
ncbi:conserved Plasmodium protein, unknown function [Plasmodium sp. gorilla clade G3]|nr:conserved Plasmodium protein, unknown function [Plasmodium sp. gorilla clade G3]